MGQLTTKILEKQKERPNQLVREEADQLLVDKKQVNSRIYGQKIN
jgi:hypothetical protein